jgi:hypothetical protein
LAFNLRLHFDTLFADIIVLELHRHGERDESVGRRREERWRWALQTVEEDFFAGGFENLAPKAGDEGEGDTDEERDTLEKARVSVHRCTLEETAHSTFEQEYVPNPIEIIGGEASYKQ